MLLFFKSFCLPPVPHKLNVFNSILFWPSASVKIFYVLNLQAAAYTYIGCCCAGKHTCLPCDQHVRDNRDKYCMNSAALVMPYSWEYHTLGSKNLSKMLTRSLGLWLISDSEGFFGPGIIPPRNIFLGQYWRWGERLSKINQIPVDETICLASFMW